MTDAAHRLAAALEDRYTIERELGAGGMATVYLAHDVRHDRKVALKVLRAELAAILGAERFLAEIKTTANLQHPHILPLHDSGEADGMVYYVMPYVEGESLRDRLTREHQLPVEEAVRIAREVADALDYAHRHGVVHRDIKPENILLHDGHVQVADFGIALAVSTAGGGTRLTETGMSLGTPHYMAPEQAMGEREITPKADVYALGCVLYEMLVGEPPFTGPTAQAIIARVVTEDPRSLTLQRRTIPGHVEAAVRKALQKLPADRFGTAAQLAEALGQPASVVSVPAQAAAEPLAGGLPWRAWLGTAARRGPWLAAAAALGGVATWLARPEPVAPPIARFAIPLTGPMAIAGFNPVLAPDGSRLVFLGLDSSRTQRVYLRAMDREAPTPVPGTEGVLNSAYFSPDGQWILFRQGTKLRKVNVSGGAALAVCDVSGGLGGMSWGARGVIVLSHGDTLVRVSADGGRPEVMLSPDSAAGALRYTSPHFLPDGRSFVAVRLVAAGPELIVVDVESKRVTPLGITGVTPHYGEGGHLVYADPAGTLLAVPFNARRRRVTGVAAPIAENVNVTQGVFARYSASRSGTIAYFTGSASERRELVLVNRDGRAEALSAPPAAFRFPRFSPDGRRIAIGVEAVGRTVFGDIWEYNLSSRRLTRLTFDENSGQPEWTPDGRYLTYARFTTGMVDIYRVAADGSTDPAPLFSRRPTRVFEARLTPDGRHVVFREDANVRDLLVAPLDSPQAARPLAATSFNERAFALSPDGRWIAFVSNLSGASEVYVRRLEEGGEPRALFGGVYAGSANDALWDVSPDGRRFAMVRPLGLTQTTSLHLVMHLFDQRGRPGGGVTAAR